MQKPSAHPQKVGFDFAFLMLLLGAIYLPLMFAVPLPTTGDQKTYIAQALEMAEAHSWFKQTLFELPNYYKGPLMFWLLRLGFIALGVTPAALIYMNIAGYALAAWVLFSFMRKQLPRERAIAIMVPGLLFLSSGAYSHALAAQMEAPLIACYAVFMALLGGAEVGPAGQRGRRMAWVVAGLAGLLKSPLHSALLGISALLYWLLTKQLAGLARRISEWLSILMGVAVCVGGFLPAMVTDFDAFYTTYIEREHLTRGVNQNSLLGALGPFFGGQLQPWILLLIVAVLAGRWRRLQVSDDLPARRNLWLLIAAMIVPTGLFFAIHFFHSDIYFLPLLPAIALMFGLVMCRLEAINPAALKLCQWVLFVVVTIVCVALGTIVLRFRPFPAWWGWWTDTVFFSALFICMAALLLGFRGRDLLYKVRCWFIAVTALYAGFGQVLTGFERHEVHSFLTAAAGYEARSWARLNLTENLWSDQGLLTVLLSRRITAVNTVADLQKALSAGTLLYVLDDKQLAVVRETVANMPSKSLKLVPYHTWRVHGRAANGEPVWAEAWRMRSLSPLEQTEYAVIAENR